MRRTRTAFAAAAAGLLMAIGLTGSGTARADDPPVEFTVMTIGDSIMANGGMQAELCRIMLLDAGLTCDVRNVAVGGTQCEYWTTTGPSGANLVAKLAEHQPDMVIFACGTNDHTTDMKWGEPETSWSFRWTVEAIHSFRTPPIPIVPVLIQYADPLLAGSPQYLLNSLPIVNDRLYVEIMRYWPSGWFPGIVDWQYIPATATYLDATGFHPTARGYRYQGRLVYDRIHAGMGWPPSSEPPLCDLYGHRPYTTRPAHVGCG